MDKKENRVTGTRNYAMIRDEKTQIYRAARENYVIHLHDAYLAARMSEYT